MTQIIDRNNNNGAVKQLKWERRKRELATRNTVRTHKWKQPDIRNVSEFVKQEEYIKQEIKKEEQKYEESAPFFGLNSPQKPVMVDPSYQNYVHR